MTVVGIPMVAMPSSRFMALMATMKPPRTCGAVSAKRVRVRSMWDRTGSLPKTPRTKRWPAEECRASATAGEEMSAAENHSAAAGPEPISAAAVETNTMARARWCQDAGMVGGQGHDGHATHGVARQHGIADIACSQDDGEVVGQHLDAQRRRAPAAGAVTPLVIEHHTVTGLDQTARHREPDFVGATPAVGEDDRRATSHIPHGQDAAVLRGDAELRRHLEISPPEVVGRRLLEGLVRCRSTAGAMRGGPSVSGGAADEGRRRANDEKATTAAGKVEGGHG